MALSAVLTETLFLGFSVESVLCRPTSFDWFEKITIYGYLVTHCERSVRKMDTLF